MSRISLPPCRSIYVIHAARALQSDDLSGEGINFWLYTYSTIFTTRGHGEPPRMRDQLYAGNTSEITRTWKTIHTIHTPIHANKVNMKGWLWRENDIRGPCGPNASWHFSYRWEKNPIIRLTQETCPDRGSNPSPLRDRLRILPPAPQLPHLLQIHFNIIILSTSRVRRVIGISGSLIWSETLMELIFNPSGEFRWSPEGPVSQIHSPHLLVGAPGIFSNLKVCSDAKERVVCGKQREATAPIHS